MTHRMGIGLFCVQGFIYSSHDQHGFFVYFGHTRPEAPHRFLRFGPHGRLARQGLPPGLVRRMERRVVPRGSPARAADLVVVQVKSKSEDSARVRGRQAGRHGGIGAFRL